MHGRSVTGKSPRDHAAALPDFRTGGRKGRLYPDGAGLYLRVGRGGAKSWAFRFMLDRKAREMGLGGLTKVSLADARTKAVDARLLLSDGKDPLMNSVPWCRIEESYGHAQELNLS
jgi:hypothetical protein